MGSRSPRWAVLLVVVWGAGCGGRPVSPAPCMSDQACRGDRICHEGRCRFPEEVRSALSARLTGTGGSTQLEGQDGVRGPVADAEEPDASAAVPEQATSNTAPDPTSRPLPAMFMGGPRRTGALASPVPHTTPRVMELLRTGGRIFAQPLATPDGSVLLASLDGTISRLAPDGRLRWRHTCAGKVYSSPAMAVDGTIFVGCADRSVLAIRDDGQLRWRIQLGDSVDAPPLLSPEGTLYVAADGLWAFTTEGRLLWHFPTADHLRAAPAWHPQGLVLIGTTEGTVVAVDARSGVQRWTAAVGGSIEGGISVDAQGRIFTGSDLGHLVALDPSGTELWRFRTGADIRSTPALSPEGLVIFGSYDRHLYALDAASGQVRWKVGLEGRIRASVRLAPNGVLLVGSQGDVLHARRIEDGAPLWSLDLGQDIDATVDAGPDTVLYVGADDGILRALRPMGSE